MKLSKIVTATFTHADIINLLANVVSEKTGQNVPPSSVTIEFVENRYVAANVQLIQKLPIEEIAQQPFIPTVVEASEPEAPAADSAPVEETSEDVSAEELLSGPTPEGASDSGVQDPEPKPETEAPAEEPVEEEKPEVVQKASIGLNFKKTRPPVPSDSEVKPESLFKFAKKK